MPNIAYIGYGFVGKACHKAFEHNAVAIIIDPKYTDNTIDELRNFPVDIAFVSINAPTLDDGSVDASVIYTVFRQLVDIHYTGLVVLKSTLPPAIIADLSREFFDTSDLRLIYSPEFLREANWEEDALNPKQIILAGNFHDCRELEKLYKNHSHVHGTQFTIVDFRVASLAKYAINCFLATKLTFMNQLYQLYGDTYGSTLLREDWVEFCSLLQNDGRLGYSHMDVPGPDGKFGYGGSCFPKDMKAMVAFDKNSRMTLVKEAELSNTQIRLTDGKTSQ